MDAEDFEFEELGISESVGLSFHRFDFVVGAFQGSGRDGVVVPGQDALGMEAEGSRKLFEHPNAGRFGVHDPIHKQGFRRFSIVLFPEFVQFVLQVISHGQRLVQPQCRPKTLGFATRSVEVVRAFQQQPADALEHVFLHRVRQLMVQLKEKSESLRDILREVYGSDYPEEANPDSFVTLTDLRTVVRNLNVGPGKTFIDLGCGKGGPGLWIARETGANYVGIDFSENAIKYANQRSINFKIAGNSNE